jgi:hypothetical protein
MFTAHMSSTPLTELLDMTLDELHYWYVEAVKLHNKLNPQTDNR